MSRPDRKNGILEGHAASSLGEAGAREPFHAVAACPWDRSDYRCCARRCYVRREPEAAKEYLRSVGLSGPFWGL
jgi:hypothetical protein